MATHRKIQGYRVDAWQVPANLDPSAPPALPGLLQNAWNNGDLWIVTDVINSHYRHKSGAKAEPTDWIVKDGNNIFVMSNNEFVATYEAI